jgi:uncharacterized protein (TIGR03083 family)
VPEIGVVYGACRERVSELVRELAPDRLGRRVAATDGWTVHDVVAHLVGVVTDINAGRFEGAGSEPWTAAQVEARRDVPLDALLAEWDEGAPQFEAGLTALGGPRAAIAVGDVWNHEQDLRGALGIEGGRDVAAEQLAIDGYAAARGGQVREAGLPALQLRAGVDEWLLGEGTPGATVVAEPYELGRLICIRRTPEQVRAYRWEGDPEPYVGLLTTGGPSQPLPT